MAVGVAAGVATFGCHGAHHTVAATSAINATTAASPRVHAVRRRGPGALPGHVGKTLERVGRCRTPGDAPLRAQDVVRHSEKPRQGFFGDDVPAAPGHVERLRNHVFGVVPVGVAPGVRENVTRELPVQLTELGRHNEYCP